jgi:FkbM family methyltransferase
MSMKSVVAYLPGLLGYEIRRKQPQFAESVLSKIDFATVLDVGANTGQFSLAMRSSQPNTVVHAFEPIPHVFAVLQNSFQGDKNLHAHNLAISDSHAIADFEVNEYSASSSFLALDEAYRQMYPAACKTKTIKVNVTTLDRWVENRLLGRPLLLKIDVQGNELNVLRGASTVLPYADYVLAEICMGAMYKGQATFKDIHQLLCGFDLDFVDFFPEKRRPDTLQCLFGDALFGRNAGQAD